MVHHSDQVEAAFANIVLQSGGATTIAFGLLVIPHYIEGIWDASLTPALGLFCALCSIPGFLLATVRDAPSSSHRKHA